MFEYFTLLKEFGRTPFGCWRKPWSHILLFFFKGHFCFVSMCLASKVFSLLPDYVLPYAIHLLAHDPDFSSYDDVNALKGIKELVYVLFLSMIENRWWCIKSREIFLDLVCAQYVFHWHHQYLCISGAGLLPMRVSLTSSVSVMLLSGEWKHLMRTHSRGYFTSCDRLFPLVIIIIGIYHMTSNCPPIDRDDRNFVNRVLFSSLNLVQ